jgi:queuine tRNA-ribosyltransferase
MKPLRHKTIHTAHGALTTPFFMPDATRGFVKQVSGVDLLSAGVSAMVVNTFHLYLQPGMKIIKKAGGIHKFMNWSKPLLSDSGGYQVFSLIHKNPQMGKISDEKVVFRSPLDGSRHEFTPEKSIQIQFDLGVDMMVVLDDCPPNDFDRDKLEVAVERTVAWAKRAKVEYLKQLKKRKISEKKRPLIFGVIQGGAELDLRKKCAEELVKIGFDGYGFGARPVDKDGKFLAEVLQYTADLIPKDAIRFALGIGTPEDIRRCFAMGWDIFDCVIPTREGRHGKLLSWKKQGKGKYGKYETLNIGNARFKEDFRMINEKSRMKALSGQSRAYLHHLFKSNDPLGQNLGSLNNLEFYNDLMGSLRKK